MTTVRSLANLHCATCGEQTLHNYNRCIECDTPSNDSGAPPVPRPRRYRGLIGSFNLEHGRSRRAARAARHQVQQRGRT